MVYLTIADKSYPRKLAFSYLDELSKEFATVYGPKVETVRKPYAFVGFGTYHSHTTERTVHRLFCVAIVYSDTFMQKTARLYQDTRTATATSESNLDRLNGDLQDVTRIMTKNMEELLWRGDSLDSTFTPIINVLFFSRPLNESHTFLPSPHRDVSLVHVVAVRVGEISQSGAGYQLARVAPPMGTRGCHWPHFHHFLMVEVFLIY